jgi:hypothetical protein
MSGATRTCRTSKPRLDRGDWEVVRKRPLGSGLAAEQPRYDSAKQLAGGALAVGRVRSHMEPPAAGPGPKRHSTA